MGTTFPFFFPLNFPVCYHQTHAISSIGYSSPPVLAEFLSLELSAAAFHQRGFTFCARVTHANTGSRWLRACPWQSPAVTSCLSFTAVLDTAEMQMSLACSLGILPHASYFITFKCQCAEIVPYPGCSRFNNIYVLNTSIVPIIRVFSARVSTKLSYKYP